ncbi:MAG: AlpA family phage regulatory protein [Nitrospinae bacterium]|nr:AlpA family phage regulatory protein [Nitrospinota bacterium]
MNIIRKAQVLKITGLSYPTVWRLMRRGEFPQSVRLTGARSVGWRENEIQEWVQNRPRVGEVAHDK